MYVPYIVLKTKQINNVRAVRHFNDFISACPTADPLSCTFGDFKLKVRRFLRCRDDM